MAHAYSHLYGIPTTGLRFFTVYGPAGRPDMSPFIFTDAILRDKPIKVFNGGQMVRDFTYIDDVVEKVVSIVGVIPERNNKWDTVSADPASSSAPYTLYNIGNSHPVQLMDFIHEIELAVGKTAKKEFLPMQPGDMYQTYADCHRIENKIGVVCHTPLTVGIRNTVEWFRNYYKI